MSAAARTGRRRSLPRSAAGIRIARNLTRVLTNVPAVNVATAPPVRRSPIDALAARLGLDRFELGVLVVLAGMSVATLVPLLTRGRPLSGADGLLAVDQLQYMTWIREASNHVLIGDR